MKKQTTLILVIIALAILATACGRVTISTTSIRDNSDVVEESRQVGNFDEIIFSGIGTLHIEYGEEENLVIEAEANLMRDIEVETNGDALVIGLEKGTISLPTQKINFYLTVEELEAVTISGIGKVYLDEVKADNFEILISGAGDISIDTLETDQLEARISGPGKLSIDTLYAENMNADLTGLGDVYVDGGKVDSQYVHISGPGTYFARYMESDQAEILISGVGSATMNVENYLKATISGLGNINFYGSPEIDANVNGLGNLQAMGH